MFQKIADMPIVSIYCSCGMELAVDAKVCPNCGKEVVKEEKKEEKPD